MLRTAYLLTGQYADAEDLVQAALVKVMPHWRKVADNPEPYVRHILARESVSRWRRGRCQREVIVLRYFEDLSEAETTEALIIAVGTVKSETRDALRVLRERMPALEGELLASQP